MQNNQNCVVSKCQMHCFCLRSVQRERRPNLNATVTMCRGKNGKNKKNKDQCKSYQGAILNKDRCYATPAFILPSEKIDYLQSTREFLRDHERKVREYEEQLDQLYVPKPRSKNMHCNVCRQNYQQYIEHIKSSSHKANIRASTFNTYILQLQDSFKMKHPKDNTLSSTEPTPRFSQDEEVQIIGSTGRKKVKQNTELPHPAAFQTYPLPVSSINYAPPPLNYPSPNMYLPTQPIQFRGFDGFNNCRTFMNGYQTSPYTFFPYMQGGFNYPMYCMPFQPMMTMDIYQPPL